MIKNGIIQIDDETIEIPVIIRAKGEKGWVPTFEIWPTKIYDDTSYIDCTQTFGKKLKHYAMTGIDPEIGYYKGEDLYICWRCLVNNDSLKAINTIYKGKLRATTWPGRYSVYYGSGNGKRIWLHSVVLGYYEPYEETIDLNGTKYVVHHLNCVSSDNRLENLHFLPKSEHTSALHPSLEIRKEMFAEPREYWQKRKDLAINEFITELALIITDGGKNKFIADFAKENMALTKEILEFARYYINLSSVKAVESKNRSLNSHLNKDYLDAFELEKYLGKYKSAKEKAKVTTNQLKWFK